MKCTEKRGEVTSTVTYIPSIQYPVPAPSTSRTMQFRIQIRDEYRIVVGDVSLLFYCLRSKGVSCRVMMILYSEVGFYCIRWWVVGADEHEQMIDFSGDEGCISTTSISID